MQSSGIKICVALLCLGATGWGMIRVLSSCSSAARRATEQMTPGVPDMALQHRAANAVLATADTPEAVAEAAHQLRIALREALDRLPPDDRLDAARADEFLALSQRRFALFLAPDYDQYEKDFADFAAASRRPNQPKVPGISRAQFEAISAPFRGMKVGQGDAHIVIRYRQGAPRQHSELGQTSLATDELKWYSDAGAEPLLPSGLADVYEARFPVESTDADSGAQRLGFLSFAFVWLPAENRWLPWQSRFITPTPEAGVVAPLPWF